MDPQKTAENYANKMGVGPQDSSTIDNASEYVNKGIETVQASVFGQKKTESTATEKQQSSAPKSAEEKAVDDAHPVAVEEFMRSQSKSDPIKGDTN